ncbi:MAG: alcohol dehydrogenase catalytic domain-containing protein [Alicyclobacillus sp.]|nr:alcohol dehydrogenase catalytic domain-containing protein [Alicyclobacillus sp.]
MRRQRCEGNHESGSKVRRHCGGGRAHARRRRRRSTPASANRVICGSDIHLYKFSETHHFVQTPIVMGHEYAGIVEKVGALVEDFAAGDAVAVEAVDYCGTCALCRRRKWHLCKRFAIAGMHRTGGFSEYAAVKSRLLHRLPNGFAMQRASWVEPVSVAVHAVEDRSSLTVGDLVLVTGPGPIGLLAAQVAREKGANVIVAGVDSDEELRLPLASKLGFHTVNLSRTDLPTWLKQQFGRDSVDWAIEASGASSVVELLLRVTEKGGGITLIGLFAHPVELYSLTEAVRKELKLLASFSSTPDN